MSETPRLAPFSFAFTLRARNASGVPPASWAAGVAQLAGQCASLATSFSGRALSPCLLLALLFQSRALAVGHDVSVAIAAKSGPRERMASRMPPSRLRTPLSASADVGVGHEPEALADVRRADARSAQIGGPDGIAQCFQFRSNNGEPSPSVSARNLLSKDDCRLAGGDETVELRPEVAFVLDAAALSGR